MILIKKAKSVRTDNLNKQINIICKLPKKICKVQIELGKRYKRVTQNYIKNKLKNGLFCIINNDTENSLYESVILQELEIDENIVKKYLHLYLLLEGDIVEIDQIKFIKGIML